MAQYLKPPFIYNVLRGFYIRHSGINSFIIIVDQ